MSEKWLPVVGFEGLYEISSHGRLKSIQPRKGGRSKVNEGIVAGYINSPNGGKYKRRKCALRKNKKTFERFIHTLVLETFHGPRPPKKEACHLNGDSLDNRATNLRWGSHAENIQQAVKHGTHRPPPVHRGDAHPRTTITDKEVAAIRKIPYRHGLYAELARKHGVALGTISKIYNGLSR